MKKYSRITSWSMLIPAVLVISLSAYTKTDRISNNEFIFLPSDSIPVEVQSIINTSCISCHSPGGKALAAAKLNFSEWNNYDEEKQLKKAEAMCVKVSKRSMPPKSYLKDHPDHALTPEQIEAVCSWAKDMNKVSAAVQ